MATQLLDGTNRTSKVFTAAVGTYPVIFRVSGTWPERQAIQLECRLDANDAWQPADLVWNRPPPIGQIPRSVEL